MPSKIKMVATVVATAGAFALPVAIAAPAMAVESPGAGVHGTSGDPCFDQEKGALVVQSNGTVSYSFDKTTFYGVGPCIN
ncbi:MAG: hypothetical protein ABIO67_10675 [Mycobacteriales bacterium]